MERMIEELPSRLEKALPELLAPNEEIIIKLKGAFKEGLICTDRRVIILKGGFMAGQVFGNDAFQQPYSNIAGVQVKFNLLSGYFEMSAGGMQNRSKSYWSTDKNTDPAKAPNCISLSGKPMANKFREACNFILEKIDQAHNGGVRQTVAETATAKSESSDDIISSIEKLGKLKDAGILSEEEFNTKKAELLSRL